MGKSVTVKPGFSFVEAPSPKGPTVYQAGETIVYTDAEYAALPTSITRCLNAPTNVPDPVRPSVDTSSKAATVNAAATGAVALALGPNVLTLTGNISPTFPTGVSVGNRSEVEIIATQDATGSRLLTLPASALASGGTDPVLSTAAGKVDYLRYITLDGGTTWLLTDKQLDLR